MCDGKWFRYFVTLWQPYRTYINPINPDIAKSKTEIFSTITFG